MKKTLFSLMLVLLSGIHCAPPKQKIAEKLQNTTWRGAIIAPSTSAGETTKEYDIKFKFSSESGNTPASYSYDRIGTTIPLELDIEGDKISMVESPDSSDKRATFRTSYHPRFMKGVWVNPDGTRLPFYMVREDYLNELKGYPSNRFSGKFSLKHEGHDGEGVGDDDEEEGHRSGLIHIRPKSESSFYFYLDILMPPPGYNMGTTIGEAKLVSDHKAVYSEKNDSYHCHLSFELEGTRIKITEANYSEGSCGWGHGVTASGDYEQSNSAIPFYGFMGPDIVFLRGDLMKNHEM